MARVYLGNDPFVPGRRVEVDGSGFCCGDGCPTCSAVRYAQRAGKPVERQRHPDATLPPPADTGFVILT
jgi:hypothetical protein